jgi:hypothetical protein
MDSVIMDKLICCILIYLFLKETGAKTLYVLHHVQLTLIILPWKRNRLLLGRSLSVDE